MKTPISRLLFCLCFLLPLGTHAGDADRQLFVFGDSLSDTGNAAAVADRSVPEKLGGPLAIGTLGLCNLLDGPPPLGTGRGCGDLFYEQSRVSNDEVAVEILAEHLGLADLGPSFFPARLLLLPEDTLPPIGPNYAVAGATARNNTIPELPDLELPDLPFRPLRSGQKLEKTRKKRQNSG